MKNNTKILIGFLLIIILSLSQLIITYKLQIDILNDMQHVKNVEAPLEIMSEQVISYDAMLTGYVHAALLNSLKGNYAEVKVYKEKYDIIGTKLDNLLKIDARILLTQSMRPQEVKDKINGDLKDLDRLNLLLVDLETSAFDAMDKNDTDTAYSLVVGGDYAKYKDELYQDYKDWADSEHKLALDFQKDILKESQQIIYLNLIISIIIMIIVIVTLLIIRSFVVMRNKSYKLLYETSNDALMTVEPPVWKFTSGNPMAIKMFNTKNEEQFITLAPGDLSPEKQPDGQLSSVKAKKMIDKAMKDGSNFFEWTHKRYKGENFSANVLLSRVKMDGKTYLQATVRDLTKILERRNNR